MSDSKHFKLKEFMRIDGTREIQKQLETYIRLLKEGKFGKAFSLLKRMYVLNLFSPLGLILFDIFFPWVRVKE
jgi:hypothetical protein